jgi:hypothetical protein
MKKTKKTKDVITDMAGWKIVMADDDRVRELGDRILPVLAALGHPEALITDESTVSDFVDVFSTERQRSAILKGVSKRLGVEVKGDDLVVDVVRRVRERK